MTDSLSITWKATEQVGFDAIMKQYAKDFPNVKVKTTISDVEQLQSTERTQLAAGTAPDVVFVWPGLGNAASIGQLAPGGYLEDLSGDSWVSGLTEPLATVSKVDNKQLMLPPIITSYGSWFNTAALKEAGLSTPTTWDEVLHFCKDATSKGKVAYALGASTPSQPGAFVYSLYPSLVAAAEPEHVKQLKPGVKAFSDSDGWHAVLDKFQQMKDAGCFPADSLGLDLDGAIRMVSRGDALAINAIGYTVSRLQEANPGAGWSFSALPVGNSPKDTTVPALSAGGPAVSATAKNKARAREFINWLATPKVMNIYSKALAGSVPSIANDQFEPDPRFEVVSTAVADGKIAPEPDEYWPTPVIRQELYTGLQGLITGQTTPDAVLSAMDKALNR